MKLVNRPPYLFLVLFLGSQVFFSACNSEARGFALPEGDAQAGRISFQALECNQCHSIGNIPWDGDSKEEEIKLGGEFNTITTYGQLVTSIINPSHRIAPRYLKERAMDSTGQSTMTVYNEVMTVQQLVDIVTYLKGEYKVTTPSYNNYPY